MFKSKKKGTSELKHRQENVEIANISFAYDNRQLISLLTKRGTQIASGKFEEVIDT